MLKTLMLMFIGLILLVLGSYLMTIAYRKDRKGKIVSSRKKSVFFSMVEFLLELVTLPFTGDFTPSLGGFAALMFIVGLIMAFLNLVALFRIHHGTIS